MASLIRTILSSKNNRVNRFMMRYPRQTSVGLTCIKTVCADLMVQMYVDDRSIDSIDWNRNAVFGTFGFLYQGCFQYWFFNTALFRLFPGTSIRSTIKKVFVDQFVKGPIAYWPVFYFIQTIINERKLNQKTMDIIWTHYKRNVWKDLKAFWSVWVPAQCITFGIMPLHLRLPFIATLSFFWCCFLSFMRGEYEHEEQNEEQNEQVYKWQSSTPSNAIAMPQFDTQ